MINLILKDVLIQKKIILLYIATIIIYLLAGVPSLIFLGFLYSVIFILNAFAYDEKDNANILLNSLPYTRKEIVSSKYIGSLIFTTIFVFMIYVGDFLINGKGDLFIWKEMLLIIGLVMVAISFIFPISYKFKMQYLLIALGVLFGIYMLAINLLVPINDILRELARKFLTLQEMQMYFVASITVIILYVGSWLLSIYIYKRRAF
ncbi:ABC-2 transporter permease [Lysinibacillus xylanilyticus]|uniref:ABC-2 transporter permease n=1 Tax=Lysinibacillus xylanilyticus TaxID=582475 RepID=A0ABT4EW18_9BACI|nr:ABC-2 transporter permease [Lysinibacillus xylanilyticus]MCY9548389.1 ABC-2 transporter permease [Lysinibacillus xylanilyticus]MED3803342.1 ABC-2 transporter permease [Lysinibacillus xylanilyticus]